MMPVLDRTNRRSNAVQAQGSGRMHVSGIRVAESANEEIRPRAIPVVPDPLEPARFRPFGR